MNQSEIFHKLVSLLGHSEHDPELQALFIELGEKFPLKRPQRGMTGLLLENAERNFQLGMEYANVLPLLKGKRAFTERELVFYSLQNLYYHPENDATIFPFGVHWDLNPTQATELLGEYFKYNLRRPDNSFLWIKGEIIIHLEFDEENYLVGICYRLISDNDVKVLGKKWKKS